MKQRKLSLAALILICFALNSCVASRRDFTDAISSGRCEDALEQIPENGAGIKLVSKTKQGAQTLLSYSLTGASYTAEIAWDAAGRTAMFVVLCGPGMALSAAASATGGEASIANPCFDGKFGALDAPKLGQNTFVNTQNLRCPDLSPLSRSVQAVATCYKSRGDIESLNLPVA